MKWYFSNFDHLTVFHIEIPNNANPPKPKFPAKLISWQSSFACERRRSTVMNHAIPNRRKNPSSPDVQYPSYIISYQTRPPQEQTLQNPSVFPSFFAEPVRWISCETCQANQIRSLQKTSGKPNKTICKTHQFSPFILQDVSAELRANVGRWSSYIHPSTPLNIHFHSLHADDVDSRVMNPSSWIDFVIVNQLWSITLTAYTIITNSAKQKSK